MNISKIMSVDRFGILSEFIAGQIKVQLSMTFPGFAALKLFSELGYAELTFILGFQLITSVFIDVGATFYLLTLVSSLYFDKNTGSTKAFTHETGVRND